MSRDLLVVRRLGCVEYEDGLRLQEAVAEAVRRGEAPGHLFLLQHPHVLTVGRRGRWDHLLASDALLEAQGVDRHVTDRGGDITYHGPGQVVGYPVVALSGGARDVRGYVDGLVAVLVRTCADFGVRAEPGGRGRVGVWVGGAKVAAIGVRIHRWVTTHGFALNVTTELDRFALIVPCGLRGAPVTTLSRLAGPEATVEAVEARLAAHTADVLGLRAEPVETEWDSVQVVVWRDRGGTPELLVLERTEDRGGFSQPVTGRVEPGETPRQAAAREVAEETGLSPRPEELVDLDYVHSFLLERWTRPAGERTDVYDAQARFGAVFCREHSFCWRAPDGVPIRVAPEEHTRAGWLSPQAAEAAVIWRGNRRALREAARRAPA